MSTRVIVDWFMQWFHIVGASLGTGGAIMFTFIFTPVSSEFLPEELIPVVREEIQSRIGILAFISAALLTTTGIYNLLFNTPIKSINDLLNSGYGRVMAAHIAIALTVSHLMIIAFVLHFTNVIDEVLPFTAAAFVLFTLTIGMGTLARRTSF